MSLNSTGVHGIQHHLFSWVEQAIFFFMIGVSVLIGVYYAIREKQNTVVDYMLGGKKMSTIPVSLSMIASFISGITLLGWPSEMYFHGTQAFAVIIINVLICLASIFFFLPVFHPLQVSSGFEYLEKRFNTTVREIGSGLYTMLMVTYIPIVIYVPALAFSQATGMSLHLLTVVLCAVCIFYTVMGGLRAVVWSDTFQSFFMFGSMTAVTVIGLKKFGLSTILEVNNNGTRLEMFNMNPDPFDRTTFWTVFIGLSFQWIAVVCVNPIFIQRYISLPKYQNAVIATVLLAVGVFVIKIISTMIGLIIFTTYHDCDPLLTKAIRKQSEILTYFITDLADEYPGLSGLFMAGIVSAGLSTMSTTLNTVSGLIYEDYIKKILRKPLTERQASSLIKTMVFFVGLACAAMVLLVERLGPVVPVGYALSGLSTGPMVFLFVYGMFFPWANTKGAIMGSVASVLILGVLIVGAQTFVLLDKIKYPGKVLSIAGCPANLTESLGLNFTEVGHRGVGSPPWFHESVPSVFRLSYMHYHTVGTLIAAIVGFITQLLTEPQDLYELDPMLIVPQMRRFLPKCPPKDKELPEKGILLKSS